MTTVASFAPLLERFFTHRLMQQRQVSPHTVSSYRDTFRQFLKFVELRLHQPPSRLNFEEIDAPLVVMFLDSLEQQQGLSVRSRNLRLTAIHSFFRYAAFEAPAPSAQIQRGLAMRASYDPAMALWDVLSGAEDGIYHAACEGACSWPFRADPTGARHPQQTLHPDLGPVSHTSRSRGIARRSGSADLVWPSRSRLYPGGRTDRAALIGNDRAQTDGPHPRDRCSHPRRGQRTQGTVYPRR